MLNFLAEHTLIIYIQFIIGSKRKASFRESFENDSEHFVSDSIFKRLNLEDSSSETVLIKRIKLSAICLVTAHSWRTD